MIGAECGVEEIWEPLPYQGSCEVLTSASRPGVLQNAWNTSLAARGNLPPQLEFFLHPRGSAPQKAKSC